MIRSMTAFARQEQHSAAGTVIWELRSVNYRYLDISPRLPEDLRALEPRIRDRVGNVLRRGKIECILRYRTNAQDATPFTINHELASQLANASREIDTLLFNPAPVHSMDVLRWPGVIQSKLPDLEVVSKAIIALLDVALNDLSEARAREGAKIENVIGARCAQMESISKVVSARVPSILQSMRNRLNERLSEIKNELDPARLEQEMVLLAQKIDVTEELDRLDAHIAEVRRLLAETKPVGRQLDFLMQEMNREANTLGSKSIDTATTRASVDLKVLIEQMREQVQNVE
jgi:uncharacterized protein (TIGR00255 family)